MRHKDNLDRLQVFIARFTRMFKKPQEPRDPGSRSARRWVALMHVDNDGFCALRIDVQARQWSGLDHGPHHELRRLLLSEDTLVVPLALLGWSLGPIEENGKSALGVVTSPGAAPTPLPDGGSGGMQKERGEVAKVLVEVAEMLVSIPR
jgi:hypothetical protein